MSSTCHVAPSRTHPLLPPPVSPRICSSGNASDERKLKQQAGFDSCRCAAAAFTPEAEEQVEKLTRIRWLSAPRRKWHDAPQRDRGRAFGRLLCLCMFSVRRDSCGPLDHRPLCLWWCPNVMDCHPLKGKLCCLLYRAVSASLNNSLSKKWGSDGATFHQNYFIFEAKVSLGWPMMCSG